MKDAWVAHPNRFAIDDDSTPGHNGDFRVVERGPSPQAAGPDSDSACTARIGLPPRLADRGDDGPTAIFSGPDWWFVVGVLRAFTIAHAADGEKAPPPCGFRRGSTYQWWDDTTTAESLLDGPDAAGYVEEYARVLIPDITDVELTDQR